MMGLLTITTEIAEGLVSLTPLKTSFVEILKKSGQKGSSSPQGDVQWPDITSTVYSIQAEV